MYIDGNWATADGVLEVTNPANGEVISSVPDGGREDAARAIEAAAKAFPSWSGLTAYQRSEYLYRAHKIMMERREDLARMMPWSKASRSAPRATRSATPPISCSGTRRKPSASMARRSPHRAATSVSSWRINRSAWSPR